MVPCAEMVRFGKNGSDVTAAAVRLARAFTGRITFAVCGYHGWQDWYIGSTARNRGVPEAVRNLTHAFAYNDLESLRKMLAGHPGEVAAVILEPMNSQAPKDGFPRGREGTDASARRAAGVRRGHNGIPLANGGAQELFGVTPDLACFGKGVAQRLSSVRHRRPADIMKLMEEIFFSFTFGGETLSLARLAATSRN